MNQAPTRRVFLRCLAVGAAAAAVPGCGQPADAAPASFGDVAAGNVGTLAVGALRGVGGAPCIVGRDAAGVYAMTDTCTHEGCTVVVSGGSLACPCHGAAFDANGNVTRGPAKANLAHFAVEIASNGDITVHGGTAVGADVRVAVQA